MSWDRGWAPYVPVAQRKARGLAAAKRQLKKGETLSPITITGRSIATTFWGQAWCDHLEEFSDYENRLPRGRTLAKNGSIADLRISNGKVEALVCGSELYRIKVVIKTIAQASWQQICNSCGSSIHSIIDLMRGKLSSDVIARLTDAKSGMFPGSKEISLSCSCPDGAYMCKHIAATMYGIGHRLDKSPELLFVLRGVNQADLVTASLADDRVSESIGLDQDSEIAASDLGDIFGIEIAAPTGKKSATPKRAIKAAEPRAKSSRQVRATSKSTAASTKLVESKQPATKKTTLKKITLKKTNVKKPSDVIPKPGSRTSKVKPGSIMILLDTPSTAPNPRKPRSKAATKPRTNSAVEVVVAKKGKGKTATAPPVSRRATNKAR